MMRVTKVEVERVSVTSSKSFEEVVAALEGVGHPDMGEFVTATKGTGSFTELERSIQSGLSNWGMMLFTRFDQGQILRRESGLDYPKIQRFVIGNPLIMKEMARHVPDTASYAPVTILIDERADGVHVSYDRMASLLAPYGNAKALEVARGLDQKIEKLLEEIAGS